MRETRIGTMDCVAWQSNILLDGDRIVDPDTLIVLYIPSEGYFLDGLEAYVKLALMSAWLDYVES